MNFLRNWPLAGLAALASVASSPASAEAADRYSTEGVTIRLVAETPDAEGRLRGAVLFDLEPGWKTYWLDPGEAGLAPTLDFSGSANLLPPELTFPAPSHFDEGGASFNGYGEAMAIVFEAGSEAEDAVVDVKIAIGICRDICVPVSAELSRDLSTPPALEDAAAIDRAFLGLPRDGGTTEARIEGRELVLPALPDERQAQDLFVHADAGWSFGRARMEGSTWKVPIRARPDGGEGPGELEAVLVDADGARRFDIDIRR